MTHAVSVSGLSKRYLLHHSVKPTYETLREALSEHVRARLRRVLRGTRPAARLDEEFWALKDVSFALQQGQRLGIIGRNGAGKSTLLKLLSRITEPTEGKIEIRGRVSSLLEVGTGFHPELTGRENIYLNGAILGMSVRDIRRRFDEIVAFAEISRFLDTPVKRYSSGMYVRLAFSVAAHLEPDILVVDEVLAVGDAQFQRKCLGRMESAGKEGRTVIFVSHNLSAVENLCPESMLLESGMKIAAGPSRDVIRKYLETLEEDTGIPAKDRKDRSGRGNIRVVDIRFPNSRAGNQYVIGDDICVEVDVHSKYEHDTNARLSIGIYGGQDLPLISCDSSLTGRMHRIPGRCASTLTCRIDAPPLGLGDYHLSFALFNSDDEPEDWISSLAKFSMSAGAFEGRSATNRFPVLARFDWQVHARGKH
jgi:lipopolysaccharide transport system ATP-binding protein